MNYLTATASEFNNSDSPIKEFYGLLMSFAALLLGAQDFACDEVRTTNTVVKANTNGNLYVNFTFWNSGVYADHSLMVYASKATVTVGQDVKDLKFGLVAAKDGELFVKAYTTPNAKAKAPKGYSITA